MTGKLDVGKVLGDVFRWYRQAAGLLLPAAAIVFLPLAVLNGAVAAGTGGVLLTLLLAAIGTVASYWFQGMVVESARDLQDGRRDYSLGELFRSVSPVIWTLVGAGIVAGIGIAIGFFLLIVPGLILLTIWAVVAPVVVLERRGVLESLGRSRALVRGNGWPVFGVLVIFFLVTAVASAILGSIFAATSIDWLGSAIAFFVVNVLVAPLSALAAAAIYFELERIEQGRALPDAAAEAAADPGRPAPAPSYPTAGAPAPPAEAPGRFAPPQAPDAPGAHRPVDPPAS